MHSDNPDNSFLFKLLGQRLSPLRGKPIDSSLAGPQNGLVFDRFKAWSGGSRGVERTALSAGWNGMASHSSGSCSRSPSFPPTVRLRSRHGPTPQQDPCRRPLVRLLRSLRGATTCLSGWEAPVISYTGVVHQNFCLCMPAPNSLALWHALGQLLSFLTSC